MKKLLLLFLPLLFFLPKTNAQSIATPIISSAACASASTCAIPLTSSITAGHTVDVVACTFNATPISSVSGIGAVVDDGFRAGLVFDKYCSGVHTFNAAGASGTITATFAPTTGGPTTTGGANVFVLDFAVTGGTPTVDSIAGNSFNSGLSNPIAGNTLTLSCNPCAVVQVAVANNAITAVSAPWSSHAAFLSTQTAAGVAAQVGVTSVTAPNWTVTSPSYSVIGAFAFGFGSHTPVAYGIVDAAGQVASSPVTTTTLVADTFGMTGSTVNNCSGSNEERGCWSTTGTGLTYANPSTPALNAPSSFDPRFVNSGLAYNNSSTLVFNYDSSIGNGTLDFASYFFPWQAYGTGTGTVALATIRFITNFVPSDTFNMDPFSIYGGGAGGTVPFAGVNFQTNGSTMYLTLEASTGGASNISSNTPYDIAVMYVQGGNCLMQAFAVNPDGTDGAQVGGTKTVACPAGPPVKVNFGDLLSFSKPTGKYIQFSMLRICSLGCTVADFPLLGQVSGGGSSQAAKPTFSPAAGVYPIAQTVTLSTTSPGAVICWNTTGAPATNGATGCSTGSLYTGPISVSVSETVFAVAGGTGYTDSAVGAAPYTIGVLPPSTLNTISVL